MQVLKNLFGLNKKIAASEIAIKYSNGEAVTLDVYLKNQDSNNENGTGDYENLNNKPKINNVELLGNKSFADLNAKSLSNTEIEEIVNSIVL